MFRRIVVLLITVFMVVPFASAQGASAPAQSESFVDPQAESTTLSILWMRPIQEDSIKLVDQFAIDFENENPGINIDLKMVDWADGRASIINAVNEGSPPDIAMIGARWVPEYVSLGIIEPLDRYLTRDFRRRFVQSIINEGAIFQGRTFGLPVATSTRALYYNKDLFKAAGIAEPPKTWDDLLAAGKAINALKQDGVYGFGLQGGGGLETNTYFYYFVWGNGGDLYNTGRTGSVLNEPAAVGALEFLQKMVNEGATQPNPTSKDYERRRNLEDMFQAGKLGMVISGPWFAPRLNNDAPDINFGLAPIPYNTTPSTYGVMDALVILKTSQQKDLAWKFMEFLYQTERRQAYAQTEGLLPELIEVAAMPAFAEDKNFAVFLSLLPDARFEPLHIQSEQIAQQVIVAVQAVYEGKTDAKSALDNAVNEINKLLTSSSVGW